MIPLNCKQIFIVEDNEVYSLMLDYLLSKNSIYRFVSFKSGEECLNNLYLNPDIIILDYGLEGINGLDTLAEIKRRSPETSVIILTANKDPELAEELFDAGADDLLFKQGKVEEEVIEKIENLLEKNEIKKQKSFLRKMAYMLIVVILLIAGFILLPMITGRPVNNSGQVDLFDSR